MFKDIANKLKKSLFEESAPDYTHKTDSINTFENIYLPIFWERVNPSMDEYIEAIRTIADIDKEDITQSVEKKVQKAAYRMMGMPYIEDDGLREGMLLRYPGFHMDFINNYEIAGYAMNNMIGGTHYNTKPPDTIETDEPIVIEGEKKSNWKKYAILGILGVAAIAGGVYYYIYKDIDRDGIPGLTELTVHGTDPLKRDTDGDGLPDGLEIDIGLNPRLSDTDHDGLLDGIEVSMGTDPLNRDSDGDYVMDGIEVRNGTNPLKMDTDGDGIDDFNELFTYNMDPTDPADCLEFMQNIPNVEVNGVKYNDGWGDIIQSGKPGNRTEVIREISLRDPLVQWFANNTEIVPFEDEGIMEIKIPRKYISLPDNSTDINLPTIQEIKWFSDYVNNGIIEKNGTKYERIIFSSEGNKESIFPAYQLTHGTNGGCVPTSQYTGSILELKDYKVLYLGGKVPMRFLDKKIGHSWLEAYKDGKVYVLSSAGGHLIPRNGFYEMNGWEISSYYDYDPNWYEQE